MLTHERLLQLVSYDPNKGVFTRRASGVVANTNHSKGYTQVSVCGKYYLAHRLAWFYMTGAWPRLFVDHRDEDKKNNRWRNLREANNSRNLHNRRAANRDSMLQHRGVSIHKRTGGSECFRAQLQVDNEQLHLGLYATVGAAVAAYDLAKYLYFGEA